MKIEVTWIEIENLIHAAREELLAGEHEGPCLNCEGQDPDDYFGWDSCYLHIETYHRRRDALEQALLPFRELP